MPNALEVNNLSISFGETNVFQGLTFSVAEGTSLAIIGPNGCGKTVLFKALVGSISYRGRIRWAPGARIGYVPQKLDIERDLPITGHDLLLAKGIVTKSREDVMEALLGVGLREVAGKPIGVLSGGQFQRLLVAMALVGRPSVLLLDEPTAGVDEPGQERLNELVQRIQWEKGLTVRRLRPEEEEQPHPGPGLAGGRADRGRQCRAAEPALPRDVCSHGGARAALPRGPAHGLDDHHPGGDGETTGRQPVRHAPLRRAGCGALHGARKLRRGPPPPADGPMIISVAAGFFLLSLLRRRA
jgi:zinc transport system ATP-binding protein